MRLREVPVILPFGVNLEVTTWALITAMIFAACYSASHPPPWGQPDYPPAPPFVEAARDGGGEGGR